MDYGPARRKWLEARIGDKDEKFDTTEIARQVMASAKFVTFRDNEEVRHYDGGVYRRHGETKIKEIVHEICDGKESGKFCGEAIGKVQRATYIDRERFAENTERKIVVLNGILDFDNQVLEPHKPEFLSLVKFPLIYDKNAQCPNIMNFFRTTLKTEDIPLMQEWFGYQLWTLGYPAQKAMMFVGDGGNGKSTAIFILELFVGRENRCAISLHSLEENRFAAAGLFGKVANLYADLPDRDLKYVGQFKMATGGDPMRGEFKGVNAFFFPNVAKMTFSCNKVPRVPEDTVGFFRRWLIIEFPFSFEGSDKEDKDIRAKLSSPSELSGLLNWSLEGLQRLRKNGWRFSNGRSVEEIREDYIVRSDPLKAFIMHCVDTEGKSESVVTKQDLFAAYKKHSLKHKVICNSSDWFFKNFKFQFASSGVQYFRPNVKGDRPPSVKGVELRQEENWCKQEFFEDIDQEIPKRVDSLDSPDQKNKDKGEQTRETPDSPDQLSKTWSRESRESGVQGDSPVDILGNSVLDILKSARGDYMEQSPVMLSQTLRGYNIEALVDHVKKVCDRLVTEGKLRVRNEKYSAVLEAYP